MDCCKRCPSQFLKYFFIFFIYLIIFFFIFLDVLPVKSIITMDHLGDQRSSNAFVKGPNELLEAGGNNLLVN